MFNDLSGKHLEFAEYVDLRLILALVGILLFIIFLTGFYPAWVLSGFKPKEVLYNKQKLSGRNLFGRSLVVLQFSLAVFFIIATIIYYSQMNFIRTKELGYEPYEVVRTHIRGNREYKGVQDILRNELAKEPSIKYLSFGGDGSDYDVRLGERKLEAFHVVIDENRLPAMQIKLKTGRNISSSNLADKHHSVIVNEAFVKAAGLELPIGTQLYTDERFDKELKTIVGVIENFHSGSLREPIKPMVMLACEWDSYGIWIRIEKQNQQRALKAIEAAYKKAMPTALYEYDFLDELNAGAYEQERRWQKIISVAAVLSVIICCLGLFGLAHLAAQRRIKEIGIRKVLGASVTSIASLLTKDFLKLVICSLLVASPLAWWVMNNWLQDFAYRIDIGWWIFALSGLIAIAIAMATVSFQAIKAGMANPVRHIWHNKLYSFINVSGLAIAITCVLLAVLFIKDERSYDRFHEKGKNLYRVLTTRTDDKGARGTVAGTGQPQGPAFKEAVPEIEEYARLMGGDIKGDVIANNKTFNLQMLFADESFFNLFSFPLLRGILQLH